MKLSVQISHLTLNCKHYPNKKDSQSTPFYAIESDKQGKVDKNLKLWKSQNRTEVSLVCSLIDPILCSCGVT